MKNSNFIGKGIAIGVTSLAIFGSIAVTGNPAIATAFIIPLLMTVVFAMTE